MTKAESAQLEALTAEVKALRAEMAQVIAAVYESARKDEREALGYPREPASARAAHKPSNEARHYRPTLRVVE